MRHQRVQDEACHADAVQFILRGLFDIGAGDIEKLHFQERIGFFCEVLARKQKFRVHPSQRGIQIV